MTEMWKSIAGSKVTVEFQKNDDDWDEDPDYENKVTEQEQRWGSKSIPGSGRVDHIDLSALKESVKEADAKNKKLMYDRSSKPSFGYGGKFGVQKDRMDQSAVGHDYVSQADKHSSQKDYAKGFGGKYGVDTEKQDKSAVGWDYQANVKKHESQTDHAVGFGGRYGVQTDRQDKSAVGWAHQEAAAKHASQTDHSKGFGGKYGVQNDRQDKSAVGWEHREQIPIHDSQKVPMDDYKQVTAFGKEKMTATLQEKSDSVILDKPREKVPTRFEEHADGDVPQHIEPEPESEVTHKPVQQLEETTHTVNDEGITAIAQFDFDGEDHDELSFRSGDRITNIEKIDSGWWSGMLNGESGIFPANFVEEE